MCEKNKKVYVVSDSEQYLKGICLFLTRVKKSYLVINSENIDKPKQSQFLENPDKYLKEKKPQVVLISCIPPSIEIDYFNEGTCVYFGKVVPVVLSYMMHRVRFLNKFSIVIAPNTRKKKLEEDGNVLFLDPVYKGLSRELVEIQAQDNKKLNDYENCFLMLAKKNGIKVSDV